MNNIQIEDLGLKDYKDTWDYQEECFTPILDYKLGKLNGSRPKEYLLLVEHPHVYTLGKSGAEGNLLINYLQLQAKQASFYKIDRGGDITYHGPGQIVGYPILDLESYGMGIKEYIYALEQVIIDTIEEYGLTGNRLNGATGVWLDPGTPGKARKLCAIGVKASRYVTMHGFALNVNTDLSYFGHINPCGFTDKQVTSLEKELGRSLDLEEVKQKVLAHFQTHFKSINN